MKKIKSIQSLVFLGLIAVLILAAGLPFQAQAASESANPIRLKIVNHDSGAITLRLTNATAVYNLKVEGEARQTFAVMKGTYDYTLSGCGLTRTGTVDLYNRTTLVNPICGGNAKAVLVGNYKVDLSDLLKVVKVKIENEVGSKTTVTLVGPSSYVFTLGDEAEAKYTIARGSYKASYYACGVIVQRSFEAYKGAKLVLKCAK